MATLVRNEWAFALLALAAVAVPASATVTSTVSGGVLTATSDAADAIAVTCVAANVQVNGADPGTGAATCASITQIVLNGGPGANSLSLAGVGGAFTALPTTSIFGGPGNDTLAGSSFADALDGGGEVDTVDGNAGADVAVLGAGDDVFVWDPGDGSDQIEGDAGLDTLRFNGSAGAELFTLSPNGTRASLLRNLGNIAMDFNAVERVELNALGGNDTITLNHLAGTGVSQAVFDLGVAAAGDVAADSVVLNGTPASDVYSLVAGASQVTTNDGATAITVAFPESANDRITVNGLGGNDNLSAGALSLLIGVTLDGGDGIDSVNGGNGVDTLLGGTGVDTIDGNAGNDTAFLGDGDDVFVWDPGDGSDIVEGQGGFDTLRFNGSAGAEIIAHVASGPRFVLTRNVGNILMDCDEVERVETNALGGIDTLSVSDLAATDVVQVAVNLGVAGSGDFAADSVSVVGGSGPDSMLLGTSGTDLTAGFGAVAITVTRSEPLSDAFVLDGAAGNDRLSASILAASFAQLSLAGGANTGEGDHIIVNGEAVGESYSITPVTTTTQSVSRSSPSGLAVAVGSAERLQLATGDGIDSVATQFLSVTEQAHDGGAPSFFPGDTLSVAGVADPSFSPLTSAGFAPISHSRFEFGPPGGRVRGTVFDDLDFDGVRDAGEPGLNAVTVFDDSNGNGVLNAGESSTLSAADGSYELAFGFDVLVTPRAVTPAARFRTTANPAQVPVGGSNTVTGVNFGFGAGTLFRAIPAGYQQTPPNASTARGFGSVRLTPGGTSVFVTLDYAGLAGNNTFVSLNAPAARGLVAASILSLPTSGATSGSFTVGPLSVTPTQAAQLAAGNWYFNIGSSLFPSGEIRGQLDDILFFNGFE